MGYQAHCYGLFSPCITRVRAWVALPAISQMYSRWCWSPALLPLHSQGFEGVCFSGFRISSLIFADDVIPLGTLRCDLQLALCEVAGIRISRISRGRKEWEINRQIDAASPVMQMLYQSVKVERAESKDEG